VEANPPPKPPKPIGMGFVLIGSELVGATLTGVAADYLAGTKGVFAITFTLLGMAAAVLLTVNLLKQEQSPGGPQ
jgi:F0F1-type ATP synthase assembly protein I